MVASRQSQTSFSDKEQIWADNASSSRFFGYTYVCYAQFRSNGSHQNANAPVPLTVLVSRDGGSTWDSKQLTPAGTDHEEASWAGPSQPSGVPVRQAAGVRRGSAGRRPRHGPPCR